MQFLTNTQAKKQPIASVEVDGAPEEHPPPPPGAVTRSTASEAATSREGTETVTISSDAATARRTVHFARHPANERATVRITMDEKAGRSGGEERSVRPGAAEKSGRRPTEEKLPRRPAEDARTSEAPVEQGNPGCATQGISKAMGERETSTQDLVGVLQVSRIHCQLKRLTRQTQFDARVALTSIPECQSRVFFTTSTPTTRHSPFAPTENAGTDEGKGDSEAAAERQPMQAYYDQHGVGFIMLEFGLEGLSVRCFKRAGFGGLAYSAAEVAQPQLTSAQVTPSPKPSRVRFALELQGSESPSSQQGLPFDNDKTGDSQLISVRFICGNYSIWVTDKIPRDKIPRTENPPRQNPPRQNPPNEKSPAAKSPELKIPRDKNPPRHSHLYL